MSSSLSQSPVLGASYLPTSQFVKISHQSTSTLLKIRISNWEILDSLVMIMASIIFRQLCMKMVLFIKATFKINLNKVLENSFGQMAVITSDNGMTIMLMGLEG